MNIFITEKDYERAAANCIPKNTVNARVRKLKWDIEKATTVPVNSWKEFKDKIVTEQILELCKQNGVCYSTLRTRVIRQKWDVYKAATTPVDTRFKSKSLRGA